jgi:hypothetical protein
VDGSLIVFSRQVHLGEDGTTEKQIGVVMVMMDGVAVGDASGIEHSVVAAGAPPFVLLGHNV